MLIEWRDHTLYDGRKRFGREKSPETTVQFHFSEEVAFCQSVYILSIPPEGLFKSTYSDEQFGSEFWNSGIESSMQGSMALEGQPTLIAGYRGPV
jgi:hypothetical protein